MLHDLYSTSDFEKNVQLFLSGNFIITIYDLKDMQFRGAVRRQHCNFEFEKFRAIGLCSEKLTIAHADRIS